MAGSLLQPKSDQISSTSRIGDALRRFESALNTLESAMLRRHESEAALGQLAGETQALRQDRTRLVHELNDVRGKASELAAANRDAAKRVEAAMARIRGVLGS